MNRKQFVARKAAPRKPAAQPGDELVQQSRARAIAFLHSTLGNRGVARLLGGKNKGSPPKVAPNGRLTIQREVDDEQARMKEAFRRGGITEEMINGERHDGLIIYDEKTGIARWEQITYKTGPAPEPLPEDEPARMKEAFRRGGITEEMIRGERRDGFINYDEEKGTATWEQITYKTGPAPAPTPKDEQARMKEAFRRGGITEEMIRGERRDGFINYDEEKGTATWEQITYKQDPAPEPLPEDEPARMKEAFRRGGITEEMIRGERTDGLINYNEETGIAKWEQITYKTGPARAPGRRGPRR